MSKEGKARSSKTDGRGWGGCVPDVCLADGGASRLTSETKEAMTPATAERRSFRSRSPAGGVGSQRIARLKAKNHGYEPTKDASALAMAPW